MKKWLALLALALLFYAGCALAEETYYTNRVDIYYHADPDCDRPEATLWWTDAKREIFARACYQKYPIGEEAALAFDRRACPICVKQLEPVYLGEHMMAWTYDFEPWGIGDRERGWDDPPLGPEDYRAEVADTYERFEARYGADGSLHPYPDAYAGLWLNNADGYSYAFVDPTQEIMDAFADTFGGGAWIVPAKYGWNEMREMQDQIFDRLNAWIEGHPELDIHPSSASVHVDELEVGMYGADWERALAAIDAELELPIWVCFVWAEAAVAVDF